MSLFRLRRSAALLASLLLPSSLLLSQTPASPEKEKKDEGVIELQAFTITGTLGATPGGAKDIKFFRTGAGRGEIPHPNTFTAEGLFSEHDLPLELGTGGDGLLRVQSAAMAARFATLPEVRYVAQLGLGSSLRAESWHRAPLNLVAVIDKSGSMSGQPLALVRASLQHALGHLQNGDQLSIVLYGDRAHVHLPVTAVSRRTRPAIAAQIDAIESMGSTNLEEGLKVGYDVARESAAHFAGNTRVMLFTDEQPNVGNTTAEGFMAMAADAARRGIGLTTIGVGVHFGAELAKKISTVRGGNLFFFPHREDMKQTFADEFDTLVTELAHDFSLRIAPARGLQIAGIFGVPGEMLRWDGNALLLDVATIFLSRRKGGIFFTLSGETPAAALPARAVQPGDTLARVKFSYRTAAKDAAVTGNTTCLLLAPPQAQAGLTRGAFLIDEFLTLEQATHAHLIENDASTAFHLVNALLQRVSPVRDRTLDPEKDLVRDIHRTLARLSGHAGEVQSARAEPARATARDRLSGLPIRPTAR